MQPAAGQEVQIRSGVKVPPASCHTHQQYSTCTRVLEYHHFHTVMVTNLLGSRTFFRTSTSWSLRGGGGGGAGELYRRFIYGGGAYCTATAAGQPGDAFNCFYTRTGGASFCGPEPEPSEQKNRVLCFTKNNYFSEQNQFRTLVLENLK